MTAESARDVLLAAMYGDGGHSDVVKLDALRKHPAELLALLAEPKVCPEGCTGVKGWCEFDGSAESCAALLAWFGGPAAGVARWKTNTNDGGWVIDGDQEFSPGDTILRHTDGTLTVVRGAAWDERVDAVLARDCKTCHGTGKVAVDVLDLLVQAGLVEQVGWADNDDDRGYDFVTLAERPKDWPSFTIPLYTPKDGTT